MRGKRSASRHSFPKSTCSRHLPMTRLTLLSYKEALTTEGKDPGHMVNSASRHSFPKSTCKP